MLCKLIKRFSAYTLNLKKWSPVNSETTGDHAPSFVHIAEMIYHQQFINPNEQSNGQAYGKSYENPNVQANIQAYVLSKE